MHGSPMRIQHTTHEMDCKKEIELLAHGNTVGEQFNSARKVDKRNPVIRMRQQKQSYSHAKYSTNKQTVPCDLGRICENAEYSPVHRASSVQVETLSDSRLSGENLLS